MSVVSKTDNIMIKSLKFFYRNLRSKKQRIRYKLSNAYAKQKESLLPLKSFVPDSTDIIDCFHLPADILDRTLITSFYSNNISTSTVAYQKKVFDLFKLPLVQVNAGKTHAEFLEDTLASTDKEFVIFFDIDAIPLRKEAVFLLLNDLTQGAVVAGSLLTANHLNNAKNNYVGPFFMGIQTGFYKQCGSPSLDWSEEFDVAAILTAAAINSSLSVKYWVPTDIEVRKWSLYRIGYFGLGTTYNGLVYHAFEGREGNSKTFVNKCKKVLKSFE